MKENEKQEKSGLTADVVMNEVMKEQKANLFATISEYIEDRTKVGELQPIINSAIDAAFNMGRLSTPVKEKGEEVFSNLGDFFNNFLNPANSKYKQLYDNQRMTTDCLLQALRLQQVQLTLSEESSSPYTDILSLIGTAASLSKANPDSTTVIEKDIKE